MQLAALELYHGQGYEQTTVAQIAQRAGLTTRTSFRHYADKREVLFGGEGALHELLVLAIAGVAESTSPIEAFAAGLKPAMRVYFQERPRETACQRHQIIAANAALQERESLKLSRLATGVAAALRERGMTGPKCTRLSAVDAGSPEKVITGCTPTDCVSPMRRWASRRTYSAGSLPGRRVLSSSVSGYSVTHT
ncbi:hypothetical protein AWB98_20620 [Mycolicibacterium conceptionense]|uniref:HTH tetR-type domain-containing protein n=1 Tax=Mycolicibacterium conceptionense TaxID=451644 RepID=A0ABX3V5L9_9MYCO|nr:hypothetical protein AWB98_20620 [Mycolicibacterium conceptionense]